LYKCDARRKSPCSLATAAEVGIADSKENKKAPELKPGLFTFAHHAFAVRLF
jgi:hypothetical protein